MLAASSGSAARWYSCTLRSCRSTEYRVPQVQIYRLHGSHKNRFFSRVQNRIFWQVQNRPRLRTKQPALQAREAPATSFPLGPPRLGKSIASQRKKKWRLLFSGKYGSTGQLGICPHEAGLDSWCRPSSWQLGGWHHITSLAIFGRRILRNEDLSGNGFTRIRRVQMCVICKSGHQRGIAH